MGDATGTDTFPGFETCVEFLRSGNSAVMEDSFFWLVEYAPRFVDELLAQAEQEQNDFHRVSFIELLGDTRSEKVIPFLERMLVHPHKETRLYSVLSLEELGFPEALALAKDYRSKHPDEL